MKRILFVLALMLVLTVCFVGEAFALNYPYGDIRNNTPSGGDDHPWGGDEVGIDPPPPPSSKYGSQDSFSTGNVTIDFVFRYFILTEIIVPVKRDLQPQIQSSTRYESLKYSTLKEKGIRK